MRPNQKGEHMRHGLSRREFLRGVSAAGVSALGLFGPGILAAGTKNPTAPVSIARCRSYALDKLLPQLQTMLDQLGGLRSLVAGKTVLVKPNLTGYPQEKALGLPGCLTYHTHPNVILAVAQLLDRAGAKRIRFVENTYQTGPIEKHFEVAGWDMKALAALHAAVDFEDTPNLGKGKKYHEVKAPWGGSLFPAYLLNHSFVECDVYVSLSKLKNHATAGVTMAVKNNFGVTPTAVYGQDKVNEQTTMNHTMFHDGKIGPAAGVPQELDPKTPRKPTYRVPRHTVDALGIRPIHLAIVDGIETVSGGEGPWCEGLALQKPGLLLAGRNPVCLDAIGTVVMGYDPMAKPGTGPFPGDNHLALAAALGLGTNNPREIEVLGLPVKEAVHPFRWEPKERFS